MDSKIILFIFTFCIQVSFLQSSVPIIITTWGFMEATDRAWSVVSSGGSALDAVEMGASACERLQCDGTVGYGGSPDEDGETTLDAMIMDGQTMNVGAVGALRNVKRAISVARKVLEHTEHSLLVGELATQFATSLGFKRESLSTSVSKQLWRTWKSNKCQPNFWMDVTPDPRSHCGPYKVDSPKSGFIPRVIDKNNHDTIGMVAIDSEGRIAAGTSTNGAKYKIPGRVGDSPIAGAGAYADGQVGGAAATGDGDVMLRFLPSFLAVEEMRRGATPQQATNAAVKRIAKYYPKFMGAVVAVNLQGEHGAACNGISQFPYVVHDPNTNGSTKVYVDCVV